LRADYRVCMAYWLIKSEPEKYPFEQLVKDKKTTWDGVRNFTARNNLRAMKKGDLVLYYHSNEGKAVVGVAKVVREYYPDSTSEGDFSAVDVAPVRALAVPVTLAQMRADPKLATMVILKQGRLSVAPVSPVEFEAVLAAGKTKLA
jgi:predicted RNA-binding protein with PUA-like domain